MIRLYINDQEIDLSEDVVFPVTFSQADAKKPESRKRSSSKTIVLPGTQNNNRFFMSAYNLKASDVYGDLIGFDYDPTLRYPFIAQRNGKTFFRGSSHLVKVTRKKYEEHGMVNNFHIVLYSEIVDMFQALGDIKVNELGWSAYDHILSVANIRATWSAATGSGVWYPLVDYGLSSNPISVKTNQLYPHVYVKEIVEKCFAHVGLVLTGGFFSNALYKGLAWGSGGGEPILLTPAQVTERRVNYTGDGSTTLNIGYSGYTFGQTKFNSNTTFVIATASFMTLTLVDDDLSQMDAPSGEIVISNGGYYSLAISGTFPLDYAFSDPSLINQSIVITVKLLVYVNGAILNTFTQIIADSGSGSQNIVFNETQALDVSTGDIVQCLIKISTNGSFVGQFAPTDTLYIDFDLDNTLILDMTAINSGLIDGDIVNVSRFLPDIKAADFLKDMITIFNLYMSDPDDNGNVTLLPEKEYFYGTDDVDQWSDKIARDSDCEIQPAANIEGKRYRFRWAEDRDYYKQLYFTKFGHDYGDFDYNVPSTFKTGDKVYQVGIAQSVPVQIEGTDIIIPRIIQVDPATQATKPHKGKPRMYLNNGLEASDDWYLVNADTGAVTTYSSYPQAHHLNSLATPTFDFNFGAPVEVFYTATAYTADNLFYRFNASFIRALTGRDSKLLNAWFRLDENDFYENFMRKMCNIDGVIYRKNIIKDWIANTNNLVKCELIRVVEGRTRNTLTTAPPETFGPAIEVGPIITTPTDAPVRSSVNNRYNATSNPIAVSLDPGVLAVGKPYYFKKTDTTALNNVVLTPVSGTIDGAANYALPASRGAVAIITDGTNFFIIGKG